MGMTVKGIQETSRQKKNLKELVRRFVPGACFGRSEGKLLL
jgi:hypothetical protein